MGHGRFSTETWTEVKNTRSSMTRDQVFTQRKIHAAFDPLGIVLRESTDSPDNPNSTPVIIAMDVTGSMGAIPEYMAKHGLGEMINDILANKPIPDPHIMVGAIGDIYGDNAPLQMSQFEADNRIATQISQLYLEGGGGRQDSESYDLPWLFAATKTKTDSFKKRDRKGYIFTVGDEPAPDRTHTKEVLRAVFANIERGYTSAEMLAEAQKEWVVFHIIAEQGSRGKFYDTKESWSRLLGPNAISMSNFAHLPQLIVAILAIAEGANISSVIDESGEAKETLQHAFKYLADPIETEQI